MRAPAAPPEAPLSATRLRPLRGGLKGGGAGSRTEARASPRPVLCAPARSSAGLLVPTLGLPVALPRAIHPCWAGLAGPGGESAFSRVQVSLWAGERRGRPCWAIVTCGEGGSETALSIQTPPPPAIRGREHSQRARQGCWCGGGKRPGGPAIQAVCGGPAGGQCGQPGCVCARVCPYVCQSVHTGTAALFLGSLLSET